ncbi:hypothetical protein MSG28_003050 [Choristoneura fumiferana]|uniref:Uncharacterized protein n=1 Tax=Choristoneura fumiferana TaxID=7141 RepID=A0ACC0JKE7_CHOFU|nr:hypothetical protein MSG28_003050 [Choristoneura fumiferana]
MPQSSLYYYAALPKQTSSFALKFSVLNTSSSLRSYPPEIRQCYFPEERQLRYFLTYTASNCRLECLSNYTFQHCGCVWFHMPQKYAAEEGETNNNISRCQCLPSCVAIQYDAEILKTKFAANSYLKGIKEAFSVWFTRDNESDPDEGDNESDPDEGYV